MNKNKQKQKNFGFTRVRLFFELSSSLLLEYGRKFLLNDLLVPVCFCIFLIFTT